MAAGCRFIDAMAKKKLKIGRIEIDYDLCIGAASCVAVAPDVFDLDEKNKAILIDPKGADNEAILLAAQSCPTQAIRLYDEKGKRIFP